MNYSPKKINHILKEELKKSRAPFTGFFIACAIITKKNVYFGHNIERRGSVLFEHAEQNALRKVLEQEKKPVIVRIIMMAGGKVKKFKNYTPCNSCICALKPYVKQDCVVELLPLNKNCRNLKLLFGEIAKCYAKLKYSKIKNSSLDKLKSELGDKTLLKKQDLNFVSDLTLFGVKNDIELFLTGSASGRGGVSNLIMKKTKKSYRDIDIIVVATMALKKLKKDIENLILFHYFSFTLEDRFVPKRKNKKGVILKNLIYYTERRMVIDLTVAINVNGAFRQLHYEAGNWYHQLS